MSDTLRAAIADAVDAAARPEPINPWFVADAVLAVLADDYESDVAYERACEQLKRDNQELRATVARYRDTLEAAQGEAYLGALDGDDTPTPLAACHSVMSICVEAVRGVGVGDETP